MKRKPLKLSLATGDDSNNAINAGLGVDIKIPDHTIYIIGGTVIVCAVVIVALSFFSSYIKKNML